MDGGMTLSLIAFGLVAAEPALRREVVPTLTSGNDFGSARSSSSTAVRLLQSG
jgi:hypothetical protein